MGRSYSSRDPLGEFKLDVRSAYAQLLVNFRRRAVQTLFRGPAHVHPSANPFGKG